MYAVVPEKLAPSLIVNLVAHNVKVVSPEPYGDRSRPVTGKVDIEQSNVVSVVHQLSKYRTTVTTAAYRINFQSCTQLQDCVIVRTPCHIVIVTINDIIYKWNTVLVRHVTARYLVWPCCIDQLNQKNPALINVRN